MLFLISMVFINISFSKNNFYASNFDEKESGLNISSEPSNMNVYINDNFIGKTPIFIQNLNSGLHQISLKQNGYMDWVTKIDFDSTLENIHALMLKTPCTIQVTSDIPGATVYINGNTAGKTPIKISGLKTGNYKVEIRQDGLDTFIRNISFDTFGIKVVHANLQKPIRMGRDFDDKNWNLILLANVDSAKVYIDSIYVGFTPYLLSGIDTIDKKIELIHPEFETWQSNINSGFGNDSLYAIMTKKTGKIQIISDLSDVNFFIDSKPIGRGYIIYSQISLGRHKLTAEKNGYRKFEKEISITDYDIYYCNADLTKSWIKVNSEAKDIHILLNGEYIGTTRQQKIEVLPADIQLAFLKPMYEPKFFEISLQPQQQIDLNISLIPKVKDRSIYLSYFLPGLGQLYAERKFVAISYFTFTFAGILTGISSEVSMSKKISDYYKYKYKYFNANTDPEISLYRKKSKSTYNEIKKLQMIRNTSIGVMVAIWTINLIDSYLFVWPDVERGEISTFIFDGKSAGISYHLEF
jgi:hypothetical protein